MGRHGQGIDLLRVIKNRLRAALPAAIFIGITAYFAWNAMHGARGLEAQHAQLAALARAQQAFAAVEAGRQQWETRIADLDQRTINKDVLDEQARLVLNLADPSDLVVQLPAAPNK